MHGHSEGGLDGIDISGTNHWVHDIEVSNKDECVTVKSPASNFLIERIYCNWSGGSAIGSLSTGTDISNIYYRNVYSWQCNQMIMIKSNGGSGSVKNVVFENFIGHSNAYSLDIDQYWSGQTAGDLSTGVKLTGITFKNWKGTCANGSQRSPIQALCSDAAPSGYSASKMDRDLVAGYDLTQSIPIPALGTSYYPGLGLIKALMNGSGGVSGGTTTTTHTTTTTKGTTTSTKTPTTKATTTNGGGGSCAALYGQCGGIGFTGPACCSSGMCTKSNDYYSQCL
ncbi:hypothetical protein H072_11063 [Dactylellina haptotyla CBS 200.50]|uniref:CBM1 domain-containing protein n=1 Tax=Dactylellina haptotyla (strain CBS 200.50) TaxID=1284197 RepID=S8B910_DACHA|nr:hypothetical protein H072_11063 [Dactylellina haptotyla CBS 200.50]